MATEIEIRSTQKAWLYDLLEALRQEPESKALKKLVSKARAVMEQEDVAWVEKELAKL